MKSKWFWVITLALVVVLTLLLTIPSFGQTVPYWRMRVAQVANGTTGNATYQTTIMINNTNNTQIEVQLEDFDHDNPANALRTAYGHSCTSSSSTSTTINFLIPAYSSCKVWTDATGLLETGWLRISELTGTKYIGGYAAWTLYAGTGVSGNGMPTGNPIFTVGVSPIQIYRQFAVPVVRDFANNDDTGYSIVNPFNYTVYFRAQCYDKNGIYQTYVDLTLAPFSHRAQFFSETFTICIGNANGFVGTIRFIGNGANDGAIASTILQTKGQFGGATSTLLDLNTAKTAIDFPEDEVGPARNSVTGRNKALESDNR